MIRVFKLRLFLKESHKIGFYCDECEIAYDTISHVINSSDIVFDQGYPNVFNALTAAHEKITKVLEGRTWSRNRLKPGNLVQDDSRKFLGLQVAHITVSLTKDIFEENYQDTLSSAKKVRSYFSRVMLNTDWI